MKKQAPNIVVVDYGVGNLFSIVKALKKFSVSVAVSEDAAGIMRADALIFPGVGSFHAGMDGLAVRGLTDLVRSFAKSGKPVLGICLGAQLLLEKGYEFGGYDGLGIIPGNVRPFSGLAPGTKVPHIGWDTLMIAKKNRTKGKLLEGIQEPPFVYFVHSFILVPEDRKYILAESVYGGKKFCSAMRKGNIYGCQFHPEKSGEVGLKIIENFINLVKHEKN